MCLRVKARKQLNCRLNDWQPGHGTLSLMDKTLKLYNPELKNCVILKTVEA